MCKGQGSDWVLTSERKENFSEVEEKKKTRMAKYIEKVLHGYMENWDSSGQMDYLLKKKKV